MSYLSKLSHLQISEVLKKDPVVLFPIGSQEQHGYLPTGIDNLLAEGYAKKFDEYLADKNIGSLIIPTLEFGYTPICQGYPGTISLSKQTFQGVVAEVVQELLSQGFKKVVIVNGHRDNQSAIDEVVDKLSKENSDSLILNPVYAWLRPTNEFTRKYPDREIPQPVKEMDEFVKKVGLLRHADRAEMSLFFALFPEKRSEYESLLPKENLPDLHDQLPGTHDEWVKVTKETHGMAGDPRNVNIKTANKVVKSMCEQLALELGKN